MLGRAIIATGDPAKFDEGIALIRDRVVPLIDSLPGSRGLGLWANRETGQFVVSSVWDDEAALVASDEQIRMLRADGLNAMGASAARIEILEPAAFAQTVPNEPGHWLRSNESRHPLDRLEANIADFRTEALPQIQQIQGVNTVGLLVNRGKGLAVANVTYSSREALEASREYADRMRAISRERYGAEDRGTMELEVVIVGIRPPVDLPTQGRPAESRTKAER